MCSAAQHHVPPSASSVVRFTTPLLLNQSSQLGEFVMSTYQAVPAFGARHRTPDFYAKINAILAILRPAATLRVCAAHLNAAGFTTPSGKPFTRERVATYLKSTAAASI
jgi:hypothetical protein